MKVVKMGLNIINSPRELLITRGHAAADFNSDLHYGNPTPSTAEEVLAHYQAERNPSGQEVQNAIKATANVIRGEEIQDKIEWWRQII